MHVRLLEPASRRRRSWPIYTNANLGERELGSLRRLARLIVSDNPALDSVALGDLQTVDSIAVNDNPLLSTAELRAVPTVEGVLRQRERTGLASDLAPRPGPHPSWLGLPGRRSPLR